jgi:hypothetical protein
MLPVRRLIPIVALVLAAGCRRVEVCPGGMQVVEQRTVPDQSVWCKSPDGRIAQWSEVNNTAQRQVCQYEEGKAHGPFRAFHAGGARWIEGQFQHGAKHGAWHQWDKTGSLVAEGVYRDGRLVEGAPVAMAAKCEKLTP